MPVIDDSDCRLQGQERYLQGAVLQLRRYSASGANWDHDHCEFCEARFESNDLPGALTEGYATRDGDRWICATCFQDFRERFGWSVSESAEPRRSRSAGRLWCGLFGAIVGGLLGLILAGAAQGSLTYGVLFGALIGAAIAFLLGLGALDVILRFWPQA